MKPYFEQEGITIYHGDCRDILPHVGRFDLCLTDPPYGIGAGGGVGGDTKQALSSIFVPFVDERPSLDVLTLAKEISTQAVIWGGNYFELPSTNAWLVWDKKLKNNWDDNFSDGELAWTNIKTPLRIFRQLSIGYHWPHESNGEREHPTQKPIELMLWCISKAKNPQSVIDPFLGSGTTLVACKKLGIRGVGIEREEKYCEIAAKRILNTTGSLFA